MTADGRPDAVRPTPAHALTPAEREQIVSVANEPRFADMPPARIVPMLADEGQYIASASPASSACCARRARRVTVIVPRRRARPPTALQLSDAVARRDAPVHAHALASYDRIAPVINITDTEFDHE